MAEQRIVLVATSGGLTGREFALVEARATRVGRAADNDIVVPDEGVSRLHAEFKLDNGTLWVTDSGSRNGLTVNGNRVHGHKGLKLGDQVALGSCTLEVRTAEPDTTAPRVEPEAPTSLWDRMRRLVSW